MKSREFETIYHPSLGRYVYEHRGNGLIVDNIMKPLKGAISAAASKAGRAVARAIGKKASKTAKEAAAKATAQAEKSGDPKTPKPQKLPEVEAEGGKLKCHKMK